MYVSEIALGTLLEVINTLFGTLERLVLVNFVAVGLVRRVKEARIIGLLEQRYFFGAWL